MLETAAFSRIHFVPSRVPPHRGAPSASTDQRREMLELAIWGQSGFVLDERELKRRGPSWMVDTLASCREEFGNRPLALILGSDALAGLPRWHRWQELVDFAHIVVALRPDSDWRGNAELDEFIAASKANNLAELTESPAGKVCFHKVTQLAIAATNIRAGIASGKSPRFLLPDAVYNYIQDNGIYRFNGIDGDASTSE